MTADVRIDKLGLKHRSIEQTLEEELARPAGDELRIGELKKQKLQIKDEIRRIEAKAA